MMKSIIVTVTLALSSTACGSMIGNMSVPTKTDSKNVTAGEVKVITSRNINGNHDDKSVTVDTKSAYESCVIYKAPTLGSTAAQEYCSTKYEQIGLAAANGSTTLGYGLGSTPSASLGTGLMDPAAFAQMAGISYQQPVIATRAQPQAAASSSQQTETERQVQELRRQVHAQQRQLQKTTEAVQDLRNPPK